MVVDAARVGVGALVVGVIGRFAEVIELIVMFVSSEILGLTMVIRPLQVSIVKSHRGVRDRAAVFYSFTDDARFLYAPGPATRNGTLV